MLYYYNNNILNITIEKVSQIKVFFLVWHMVCFDTMIYKIKNFIFT